MKVSKRLMMLSVVLSLCLAIYGWNTQQNETNLAVEIDNPSDSFAADADYTSKDLALLEKRPLEMTWCGTGPSGQVQAGAIGGNSPYTWTIPSAWNMQSSFSGYVDITTDCNSGQISVTDSNGTTVSSLIPSGCVDHGCN